MGGYSNGDLFLLGVVGVVTAPARLVLSIKNKATPKTMVTDISAATPEIKTTDLKAHYEELAHKNEEARRKQYGDRYDEIARVMGWNN